MGLQTFLEVWYIQINGNKQKFIAALCTSCYGSTYDIFDSFNDILQGNRLDDFSNIQIAIANYKELIRIYGKAYEKVLKEYENLKIEVHHIKEVLIEVESECFSLSISNPQFQKKIENFMKSKDKSEKNLQIILDDLTYLIDKLNRILNKKTQINFLNKHLFVFYQKQRLISMF